MKKKQDKQTEAKELDETAAAANSESAESRSEGTAAGEMTASDNALISTEGSEAPMEGSGDTAEGTETSTEGEHHHHHHHHHSKSWHRRRRLRRKLKKNGKTLLIIALCLLALVALAIVSAIVAYTSMIGAIDNGNDTPVVPNDGVNRLVIQSITSPVVTTHETVDMYINSLSKTTAASVLSGYGRRDVRTDFSVPVTIYFSVNNIPSRVTVTRIIAMVSEHEDFSDATLYTIPVSEQFKLELDLLKVNTTYYVKLIAWQSDNVEHTETTSFTTEALPRFLSIERLYNVRDIGGWALIGEDKYIRQDLLFRGSELDGYNNTNYKVSPDGIKDLLTTLNIRSEFDLRAEGEYFDGLDMLGQNVSHNHYPVPAYTDVFSEEGMKAVGALFSDLADPDNYPIYMHDTDSIDRTGTVIAILEAYLGMQESDIMKEYDLSAFSSLPVKRGDLSSTLSELKQYPGKTLSQKAQNYLLACGVTQEELDSIYTIFIGD